MEEDEAHADMDENNRHQQDTNAEHAPEAGGTLHVPQTPYEEPIAHEQQGAPSGNRQPMTAYERSSRKIQAFIALVTVIYAIVAGLQWQAMKETLQISKEAIDLSKRSLELTKRPWVVLTRVNIDAPFAPHREMKVRAFLKNTGETPALAFSASIQSQRQPFGVGISCDDAPVKSLLTLGPHEELPYDTAFSPLPQPIADLILMDIGHLAGAVVLYICGKVSHRDIFSADHSTEFCAFYSPKREAFVTCLPGNSAD